MVWLGTHRHPPFAFPFARTLQLHPARAHNTAQMPKATPLSTLERAFILDALRTGQRVDGRSPYDVRTLQFAFGQRPGVVQAQLGRTRFVVLFVVVARLVSSRVVRLSGFRFSLRLVLFCFVSFWLFSFDDSGFYIDVAHLVSPSYAGLNVSSRAFHYNTCVSAVRSVLAVVSAEITKPFGDRGSEGMLQFATSFSGMAELGVDNSSRCGEFADSRQSCDPFQF